MVGREIAIVAGLIDLRATGLEDRMMKMVRSDPRPWVRTHVLRTLLDGNWDNPIVVAAVKELVNDPAEDVRHEAIDAFDVSDLREQACPFWLANLGHKDARVADKSMFQMMHFHKCKAHYEAAIDALEKRPLQSPENLSPLCEQGPATDKVKKRITALTDKWAQDASLQPYQRVQALGILAKCDAQQAKKTAAALSKDADEYVRENAAVMAGATPKR
jgi:hypothetical protein